MKLEFEKKMKIASDLLSYCHLQGAAEYHLDIKVNNDSAVFVVKASPVKISDEDMKMLRKLLGAPRQKEMEQGYWELVGSSEEKCEMTLIGMMCDEAEAQLTGDELTITVVRKD
ncbi:MAG: hypothetical protein LBC86_08355 [Oscillospiraceae bacterium]|jgi:hypothetical protein|nr:hypothetical protein [Oscillospiraceae bacterium]